MIPPREGYIGLLNGSPPDIEPVPGDSDDLGGDPIGPARGIGWAILISCIIWGAIALIILAARGVDL